MGHVMPAVPGIKRHILVNADRAELTIADDGKGFDIVETRKTLKGLGLVNINERVRLARGTVSIVTQLNKGTRVRVVVPTHPRPTGKSGGTSGPSIPSA